MTPTRTVAPAVITCESVPSSRPEHDVVGGDMDRLIVVSGDWHATGPPDAWPRYLEAEYHDHLPEMHEDDAGTRSSSEYSPPSRPSSRP